MAKKVCIDPGHGGSDPGAVANGLRESDMTLTMSFSCRDVLVNHGLDVMMTRTTDVYVDLNERCRMANRWGANLFVSIHVNSGGGDGAEVIHSIHYGNGTVLAKDIVNSIKTYTPQNLRPNATYSKINSSGTSDYYAVIRGTNMSSVIVETAFIDNRKDIDVLDTKDEQKLMGRAIAYGILKNLGISFTADKDTGSSEESRPVIPNPVPNGEWAINAKALVALDPRDNPSTNYKDMGEIYRGEGVQILPEVCDKGIYLPIIYWKDGLNKPSDKVWISCNQRYLQLETNATVVDVATELDARYSPSPSSNRMGYVKNKERLFVHKEEGNYVLATYFAGSGYKTAWFTKKYVDRE